VFVYQLNFSNPQAAKVVATYNEGTLQMPGLNITSFDIEATESVNIRQMFLTDFQQNIVFITIMAADYTSFFVQSANIQKILNSQKLYMPEDEVL
jgi:hypothetical protein